MAAGGRLGFRSALGAHTLDVLVVLGCPKVCVQIGVNRSSGLQIATGSGEGRVAFNVGFGGVTVKRSPLMPKFPGSTPDLGISRDLFLESLHSRWRGL
jgi:hypothetical protein